ncbi:GDP-mannose 4,6-dehydratase [Lysobacter enzymogenes]|uniref:NAD dependent epimerase/dehydratase family protein n=1 Tax=Lysobacter enzymogenes TaxID=69 RepID=A0A0S2DM08_LYSEN|nr:GDP-mannose 4,6-dehydratase [Lysobacter enzymogenes]ALN59584.1 NAD dependent epimerase/dehydratase family protein [Lysobacter enzymogenes]QCW27713.1 NAD-dependent epimerase/dehydratase family protein [Lysobacter enzymogenes]QQQ02348.1 GDP-mannose 4,6-dehydratase [Lysobacter enzymogenes]UZW61625.1 GDP-mannose 4,6-dehydratase [Lysobacter enzymogenes]
MSGANAADAPRRLLVTGGSGFVGRYVEAAVRAGDFGDYEFHTPDQGWDIRDAEAVNRAVEELRPHAVLHLAAQSFVPRSFEDPRETFEINTLGTLNLLQALKRAGFDGRLLYISSGDVYGQVAEAQMPVTEALLPAPRNPYAVSKLAAEQLCLQWQRSEGLDAIVLRPFNHIGPGQGRQFVLPALASQVAAIAQGRQAPVIEAGDIDTTRDFTDVRDIVAAYAAALRDGVSGQLYLVASGVERKVRDLLEAMCRIEGVQVEVRQDPAKLRRAEQRRMVGSAGALREATGWAPRIPMEQTLQDILLDQRNQS